VRSLLHRLGRVVILPFTLTARLLAWLLTALVQLTKIVAILFAEFAVGALAVLIPLALVVGVLFGLFYLASMVLDGLW